MVLRRYVPGREWIILTMIGMAAGNYMNGRAFANRPAPPGAEKLEFWLIGGGTIGACIGIAQWFVLRQRFEHAGGWIYCSAFSRMIAYAAGFLMSIAAAGGVTIFFFGMTAGLLDGRITSIVLARLLQNPINLAYPQSPS